MPKLGSVSDVFDAMGGASAVGRALGIGQSTASEMKRRGRIPAEYWNDLIRLAHSSGISDIDADMLVHIHAREPTDPKARLDRRGPKPTNVELGHFTRFKPLRRNRFRSLAEINDHVAALREEWDRR